ncbi:acyltransferase [Allofranklinella schreckenbergeri]|uniref:Acyltransferase n=1 Tax=Allofranklinella schreckenbergeri TaxID=1076744 RepID=A0A3M6PV61_9BURK|nr:acyltransferase [Allofranklinella schreckenbergeri]RMW94626.1 acyltransferase [Allofranklinella schreckenbergeri]
MNKLAKTHFQRNFGLDVLRTLAISVVLMNHGFLGFFIAPGLVKWEGWTAALSACAVFSIEWLFVLSGFLIGSMMIRSFETQPQWWLSARDFWLRRWFRTVPNYYLFLFVSAIFAWLGIGDGEFELSFLFFSQNLITAQTQPYFFSESWSLALDEWFYFLMPLLLGLTALLFRLPRHAQFWAVALTLITIPTILRFCDAAPSDFLMWDAHVRRVTIMHLDATGWGVAAAILNRWHPQWWTRNIRRKALIGLGLTLGSVIAMCHFVLTDWQSVAAGRLNDLALITTPSVATVLALPWLSNLPGNSRAARWISAKVGDYAYSSYLCHMPLLALMLHAFETMHWSPNFYWVILAMLVWLILVFFLSALVFHNFEKPVSDLRDRFTKRVYSGPFERGEYSGGFSTRLSCAGDIHHDESKDK